MFDAEKFEKRTGLKLIDPDRLDASHISPAIHEAWRAPRPGTANPERLTNPRWEWLVRTGIEAYQATSRFGGPSPFDAGPAWCFERLGQSVTVLPDGTRVFVGGEHEDYYDPDFFIYNDVVIWKPDGAIEILGYPVEIFPPTDFHTATLLPDRIVLIGNLGCERDPNLVKVQVAVLSLGDWSITLVDTHGEAPPWIHSHLATWNEERQTIHLHSGLIDGGDDSPALRENLDEWELNPETWTWKCVWKCPWPQREILRADRKSLDLWSVEHALTPRPWESMDNLKVLGEMPERFRAMAVERAEQAKQYESKGVTLALFESLFLPEITGCVIERQEREFSDDDDGDYDRVAGRSTRIVVNGVTVRFTDRDRVIHMVVEGDLPGEIVEKLAEDCRAKLEAIQGSPCIVASVASPS